MRQLRETGVAVNSGLEVGDVIVSIGDETARECNQAAKAITSCRNPLLQLSYHKAADAAASLNKKRQVPKLAVLSALEADMAHLSFDVHPLGLVIASVGAGYCKPLQPGDVVVTLGGSAVKTVKAADALVKVAAAAIAPVCLTYYEAKAAAIELAVINSTYDVAAATAALTDRSTARSVAEASERSSDMDRSSGGASDASSTPTGAYSRHGVSATTLVKAGGMGKADLLQRLEEVERRVSPPKVLPPNALPTKTAPPKASPPQQTATIAATGNANSIMIIQDIANIAAVDTSQAESAKAEPEEKILAPIPMAPVKILHAM